MSEPGRRRLEPRQRGGSRRMLLGGTLFLVIGLALPYLLIDDEQERLDDAARSTAGGDFVRLSAGYTHYEVAGPADGQPVVLVHGTTMPSLVWDRTFTELANAGLRVMRYDLFGRGLSDRPDARYDLDLYESQLDGLLAEVAPGEPVDLVGFSMGGLIVTEFARRHPERVRKLVLIAPAGVQTDLPLLANVAMAPGVGEYIFRIAGTRQLRPSRRMVLHPDRFPELDSMYLSTIRFRGSRRAVLESLRRMPFNEYEESYQALGALGKPVLLVWGRHDAVVPLSSSRRVRELVGASELVVVDDAGHSPHFERPDVVNPALRGFLAR